MEKLGLVDQKTEQRLQAVLGVIQAHPELFRRQGSVVATCRRYQDRRLGPFFSLRYRDAEGRQQSLYIGSSAGAADIVKETLRDMQRERREKLKLERLMRQARADLRVSKYAWRKDLAASGLRLQGFEVRGWRPRQPVHAPAAPTEPMEG